MSLTSLLPKPVHSVLEEKPRAPVVSTELVTVGQCTAPPYGKRSTWAPRKPEDFGDGGAYPECHLAQYPLGMGRKDREKGGRTLQLSTDEEGNVQYDAILRQGTNKDKVIKSTFKDLLPVAIIKDDPKRELPDEQKIQESTEKTKMALEKLVSSKISSAQQTFVAKHNHEATYIRYTPASQVGSGGKQRIIRMVEEQKDPLEPPKFKTNSKLPRGPPSPPAPVMHSPPRKATQEEHQNWKIPPCISNWKNSRGYVIPLDKRLAADGRGLQDVQINDNFAKFTEALYIAERKSRETIEMRQQIQKRAAQKDKEKKEETLRGLAQRAREQRSGVRVDADQAEEVMQREEIRADRRRDRERLQRISQAAPEKRNKLLRDRERDVSERIALGLPARGMGEKGGFDQRLFGRDEGMSAGFGNDDDYNVYDKPFRAEKPTSIYRPAQSKDDFDENDYEKIKTTDRFRADKGFSGTDGPAQRSGPVQFEEKQDEDVLGGLQQFLTDAKEGSRGPRGSRKRGYDSDEEQGDKRRRR